MKPRGFNLLLIIDSSFVAVVNLTSFLGTILTKHDTRLSSTRQFFYFMERSYNSNNVLAENFRTSYQITDNN